MKKGGFVLIICLFLILGVMLAWGFFKAALPKEGGTAPADGSQTPADGNQTPAEGGTAPTEPADETPADNTARIAELETEIASLEEQLASRELILVNSEHPAPADLEPRELAYVGEFEMDGVAAEAMNRMLADAETAGFTRLYNYSGYRGYDTQEVLYDRQVQVWLDEGYGEDDAKATAATIVAYPGTSEHQTGLCADICDIDCVYLYGLEEEFADYDDAKWLAEHAHEYGFILRYPKDKQDVTKIIFEPWHFRYVGMDAAAYIYENGLCLEEYIDYLSGLLSDAKTELASLQQA